MPTKSIATLDDFVDPDDAPELTDEMLAESEHWIGNRFIGIGPGGRGVDTGWVTVYLDKEVLAALRQAGPGWQSNVNGLLREALRMAQPEERTAENV